MEGNVEETAVKELESGMEIIAKNLTHIRNICRLTDEEDKLQEAMVERYENILSGMEQASIRLLSLLHMSIIIISRRFPFFFFV